MPIERRKSFQASIVGLSLLLSLACWFTLRPHLPKTEWPIQAAAALLSLASAVGFVQIFEWFLPLILVRLFPRHFQ